MQALSQSTATRWKQIDGVQVFTPREMGTYDSQADMNVVLNWIAALSDAQKVALTYSRLPFRQMSQQVQQAFLRMEYDPDMRFVLLDKSQEATIHLELSPTITLQRKVPKFPFRPFTTLDVLPLSDSTLPSPDLSAPPTPIEALDKAPSGALKFEGEVLPLSEITSRAAKTFGSDYSLKNGEKTSLYFASGNFDKPTFDKVLQEIRSPKRLPQVIESKPSKSLNDFAVHLAQLRPELQKLTVDSSGLRFMAAMEEAQKTKDANSFQSILDGWTKEYGYYETLPLSDFLQNKQVRVDLLSRERPGLASQLKKTGMTLDDKATLSIFLQLVVEAPGQHQSSMFLSMVNGRWVRGNVPNKVSVTLSELSY